MEVDASDTGIGAVLSQRSEEDQQVHPVAFLSRRFTPAEHNYDVGNRELLAVHAAMEEWRHWLEGAQHPVLIWTDHKNLHPGCEEVGSLTGALGSPVQPIELHPHLPARLEERAGGRTLLLVPL